MTDQIESSWGFGSHEMYTRRWQLIEPCLTQGSFVLVDWGSDAGWFSVKTACAFREAEVVSVEAGLMTDGQGIRVHQQKIQQYGATNNTVVDALFGPATFRDLKTVPSDYQLVLSVFHHLGDGYGSYLNTPEDWNGLFADMVRGAKVTLFEIPNESSSQETPHRIREWYGNQPVEQVLRAAIESEGLNATIELLGETQHGEKGARKLFRIINQDPVSTASSGEIADYIRSTGQRIRMRPYRRLRFALAHLMRKVNRYCGQVIHEHAADGGRKPE